MTFGTKGLRIVESREHGLTAVWGTWGYIENPYKKMALSKWGNWGVMIFITNPL